MTAENLDVLIMDMWNYIVCIPENMISKRFKRFVSETEGLKLFVTQTFNEYQNGKTKILYKMKRLYCLRFQRLTQVDEVNIIHSAFLWSQITIKRYPQFWGDVFHFKTKNLKPCSGFKPNADKWMFFTEVCERLSYGGTTAN